MILRDLCRRIAGFFSLEESLGYITVIPQVVEECSHLSELHSRCESLRNIIRKCLSLSTEAVLGCTVAKLVEGFECPCEGANVPHLALPSETGKALRCTRESGRQLYSKQQRIWYSTVDGALVSTMCSAHIMG